MFSYAKVEKLAKDLGVKLLYHSPIKEGDLYIAHRNQEPVLLEARKVKSSYIIPTTSEYCYNISECVKVVDI